LKLQKTYHQIYLREVRYENDGFNGSAVDGSAVDGRF
jgi:hypothetical protein